MNSRIARTPQSQEKEDRNEFRKEGVIHKNLPDALLEKPRKNTVHSPGKLGDASTKFILNLISGKRGP